MFPPPHRHLRSLLAGLLVLLTSACGGLFDQTPSLSQQALAGKLQQSDQPLLLDVRSPQEFRAGHIPGAINIDVRRLPHGLPQLSAYHHNEVVVYCETGSRARYALSILRDEGFEWLELLDGDMGGWRRARLPAERGAGSPVYPRPQAAPSPAPTPAPTQAPAGAPAH